MGLRFKVGGICRVCRKENVKQKTTKLSLMNLLGLLGLILPIALLILSPSRALAQEPLPPAEYSEREGNFCEITNSDYLKVTLESEEKIKIVFESIPKIITLDIATSSEAVSSTILKINGLEPNKTYFRYQDSFKNGVVFVSNENGSYSWYQDLTKSHHVWFQEEKGTIFLSDDATGGDCTKVGIWDALTKTCTLNQDLTQSVEITTSSIVLDCDSHKISGTGSSYGIIIDQKTGVTI